MTYCQFDPKEHISMKCYLKIKFSFKKMHFKTSAKWWPFCFGLNVFTEKLMNWALVTPGSFSGFRNTFFLYIVTWYSGLNICKDHHLSDFQNLIFFNTEYISFERKLCQNPLGQMAILFAQGRQAIRYIKPWYYYADLKMFLLKLV